MTKPIWVEIRSKNQYFFLLCNIYRPPWTYIDYWTRLTYAIELALQVNENIIITGDLNSNLLCSNNDKLIDLVNIFNLKNVIDKPTRIIGNTSTLLDPIILSDTLNCNYSDVLKIPRHISDHDAAIAFIKCLKASSKSFTRVIFLSCTSARYIESNTVKSARQGNLRHPRDFPVLHFLPVFDFISHFYHLFLVSCLFMYF